MIQNLRRDQQKVQDFASNKMMKRSKARATIPARSALPLGSSAPSSKPSGLKTVASNKKKGFNLLFLVASTALLMIVLLTSVFYWTLSSGAPATQQTTSQSQQATTPTLRNTPKEKTSTEQSPSALIAQFRKDFTEKYGSSAIDWYHKGVQPFGSLDKTASRFLSAENKFVMAFAGYSVTVGRGNYFSQSFPFVLERLLKPLLKDTLSLDLEVRNAAIGGIPSFPYAFCMAHFLGEDADVISWDYSMNEGNAAAVMESYIRLSQKALEEKQPMMIVLDKNPQRKKLLQDYADLGILQDGLSLSRAGEFIPKELLEEKDDTKLPVGLQKWDDFGAPQGCPGKSSWHPKLAEHELLGHLLAMHFVDALERALELKKSGGQVKSRAVSFPKPLMTPPDNAEAVTQLLYGHANGDDYELHDLSCRTSFLPAQDHDKVLPSVVVDGLAPENPDIMLDRDDALYETGWVLDVSKVERDTKKKVERCGGLGYVDMKIALYGIPASGTLRLWLPYEGKKEDIHGESDASPFFDDLILCEANEKRDDAACRLDRDLKLTVGGLSASGTMMNGAGVYLNRQTCVHVEIPSSAQLTALKDLTNSNGYELTAEERARLSGGSSNEVGLVVDIEAASTVTRAAGACCISHIVWEQH